jgi:hypothetical protein
LISTETLERAGRRTARVCHQDVDATETLYAGLNQAHNVFGLGNITRQREHLYTRSFRNLTRCLLNRFSVARAEHQRRAFGGELFGYGATESAAGGRDQSDFSFETEIHLLNHLIISSLNQ